MSNCMTDFPNDSYIFRMTDCTGMFQHARYSVPDPSEGYTTDDNARALVMAALLYEEDSRQKYLDLIYRYLSFLVYAEEDAWFRNFMSYDRNFMEKSGSQDCFGRCLCCLGFTAARDGLPEDIRKVAGGLLEKTASSCSRLTFLRSKAYALIGLRLWNRASLQGLWRELAESIASAYERSSGPGWRWFEDAITYCNAVLPLAILVYYEASREKRYLQTGLESLDFLLNATVIDGVFHPVGCKGWFPRGKAAAGYDQQPVEACATLLACLKAYGLTGEKRYRDDAKLCRDWYSGRNSLHISLIDADSGGCRDGLKPDCCNGNEGAESLISWMIASLVWRRQEKEQ